MAKDKNKQFFAGDRYEGLWTGIILLIIGGALLAQKMGAPLPYWLFSWPVLLILIGIITGIKHNFRNTSWLIMIGIGAFFLSDKLIDDMNLKPYFLPILFIGLGLIFILRPKKKWHLEKDKWNNDNTLVKTYEPTSADDVVTSTSIFSGVKKIVTSKDFKGGEIICFMGGAEINLSQADITSPVSIDILQAFGGTKLIVPPHWEIRTDAVVVFGGIEDKRPIQPGTFDPNKILILKGTTVFGGIEIKSY